MMKRHIDGGSGAYLIPIHMEEATSLTIFNSTTQTTLEIGEMVYINMPVVVDKGAYFALILKQTSP
jgi:hypothetical protein